MALDFPQIDPVAFAIGPVQIRWYALAYMAGFLLGWRYCLHLAGFNEKRPSKDDIDDFLPYAILGVILGGRLGYVLFYNPWFYLENPGDIVKVWQGGMAFHGGITGVVVATLLFCKLRNIPLLRLADMLACATPIGLFFGRLANFINGELYGRVSDVSWAIVFPGAGEAPRHPSQLYEAILEGFVLFLILLVMSRFEAVRERPGILAGVFLMGYGLFRSFVEFYREPDEQLGYFFEIFTMGQILCLPMVLGGLALLAYGLRRRAGS